jgi:sugar lactone lactonase YvrE
VLTAVAGADWLFPADGRSALNAPLARAGSLDITLDPKAGFYISDDSNQMVMRVGTDGIINVVAGNGINTFSSGDGGLAVNAALATPVSIALDKSGNLFVGEYAGRIRKVTPSGLITTIAGGDDSGLSGDGGPASKAQFYGPYGLAVDPAGNIYVADRYNIRIRKIGVDGIVQTIAGGGTQVKDGIAATSYQLSDPIRIRLDGAGNLYITDLEYDTGDNRILQINTRGIITTVAGGGSDHGNNIAATTAFITPTGMDVDLSGNVFFSDFSGVIRKVDTRGILTT